MIGLMIRTGEMHLLAELGVVSLWQGELEYPWRSAHEYHSGWINSLRGVAEAANSPDEYMELTQMELFPDQVFCLTPKGKTIRLPKGGTPLDFAYAIHTDLGNTVVSAIVNGKPQPLHCRLNNGDLVEIVTSPSQHPAPRWEDIVVTGKARAEIRRVLNQRGRQAAVINGRRMLSRAMRCGAGATWAGPPMVRSPWNGSFLHSPQKLPCLGAAVSEARRRSQDVRRAAPELLPRVTIRES